MLKKLKKTAEAAEVEPQAADGQQDVGREYSAEQFLSDLCWTFWAYLVTVVVCTGAAAGAIVIAILFKVSYGVMLAVATVIVYISAVGQILYIKLGFSYLSLSGELRITEVYGRKRNSVYIPRRLLWLEVTEIRERAFCHSSSAKVQTVYLPKTLKKIGRNAFEGCESLERICFEGSESEWNAVEGAELVCGVEIVFGESSGYPAQQGVRSKKRRNAEKISADGSELVSAPEKEEKR